MALSSVRPIHAPCVRDGGPIQHKSLAKSRMVNQPTSVGRVHQLAITLFSLAIFSCLAWPCAASQGIQASEQVLVKASLLSLALAVFSVSSTSKVERKPRGDTSTGYPAAFPTDQWTVGNGSDVLTYSMAQGPDQVMQAWVSNDSPYGELHLRTFNTTFLTPGSITSVPLNSGLNFSTSCANAGGGFWLYNRQHQLVTVFNPGPNNYFVVDSFLAGITCCNCQCNNGLAGAVNEEQPNILNFLLNPQGEITGSGAYAHIPFTTNFPPCGAAVASASYDISSSISLRANGNISMSIFEKIVPQTGCSTAVNAFHCGTTIPCPSGMVGELWIYGLDGVLWEGERQNCQTINGPSLGLYPCNDSSFYPIFPFIADQTISLPNGGNIKVLDSSGNVLSTSPISLNYQGIDTALLQNNTLAVVQTDGEPLQPLLSIFDVNLNLVIEAVSIPLCPGESLLNPQPRVIAFRDGMIIALEVAKGCLSSNVGYHFDPSGNQIGGRFIIDSSVTFSPGTVNLAAINSSHILVQSLSSPNNLTLQFFWVNLPPFITNPISPQTIPPGSVYSLNLASVFGDPDLPYGDRLRFSLSSLPSWLQWNNAIKSLSGTSPQQDSTISFNYTATDLADRSATETISLTIQSPLQLPPPKIVLPPQGVTAFVDKPFTFNAASVFEDPNGSPLTLTAVFTVRWLSFKNNILSGTPGHQDTASALIALTATDALGLSTTTSFTIQVVGTNMFFYLLTILGPIGTFFSVLGAAYRYRKWIREKTLGGVQFLKRERVSKHIESVDAARVSSLALET